MLKYECVLAFGLGLLESWRGALEGPGSLGHGGVHQGLGSPQMWPPGSRLAVSLRMPLSSGDLVREVTSSSPVCFILGP